MPFPLLSLPYGLQTRLRELSTPVEAYHLQIATAGVKNYILPLQVVRRYDSVALRPNAEGETQYYRSLAPLVKTVHLPSDVLEISTWLVLSQAHNLTFPDSNNSIINAHALLFDSTSIYLQLFQQVVVLFEKPITEFIVTGDGSFFFPTFIHLFQILPDVERISFLRCSVNSDWENEMLEAAPAKLKRCTITINSAVGLNTLKIDVIRKIFDKLNFTLIIHIDYPVVSEEKLTEFVQPHFVRKIIAHEDEPKLTFVVDLQHPWDYVVAG
uniref:F-box domain-containing protein n=1 Tax=Panagrellus redivivus TaxID=6233 RepID=A0A7E4UUU7_PANRE